MRYRNAGQAGELSNDEELGALADELEQLVRDEFGVGPEDIRVRVRTEPVPGVEDKTVSKLSAEWIDCTDGGER